MFAERLRTAMNKRGMRNRDIVEKSKQLGYPIGSNAVSQWLSGKYVPKQDKIVILSRILDVSELWLIGISEQNDVVNTTESELLSHFRKLNSRGKEEILLLAKLFTKSEEFLSTENFNKVK